MADHGGPGTGTTAALVGFCRSLRAEGLSVPVSGARTYVEALSALEVRTPDDLYWAGRCTLVARPEDVATYDRVFSLHFGEGVALPMRPGVGRPPRPGAAERPGGPDDAPGATRETERRELRYSGAESLRSKDFADCSDEELAEAMEVIRRRRAHVVERPSHRWRSARRGHRLDVRCMMRGAMRRGGELPGIERMDRAPRQRRLILLCDVSGSMEAYARAMLRFAHVLVAGHQRVEAFAVGTRLTRLTRELSSRDPDAAMATASVAVRDWSGGTRLGEGLREFNDRFGVRGMARGAEVVVLSDGWDRGDPDRLGTEVARLHRVAHQVIWVNPMKGDPRYQPLARGMAAALPHLDRFVSGHDLSSLEVLLEILEA